MKQDIFTQVGKRTPFRTPEGFFDQQERSLKMLVSEVKPASAVKPLHRKWWYAAAACSLLLISIYPVVQLVHPSSASDAAPIYSQTSSVSDDWSDFAEADMFLDNMNW